MSIATSAPTNGYTEVKPATTNLSNTTVSSLSELTHYNIWLQDQAGNVGSKGIDTLSSSRKGLFADIDSDGKEDGLIVADFSEDGSGYWGGNGEWTDQGFGSYSWTKRTNLKQYTTSTNETWAFEGYIEGPIVSVNKRFKWK